MLETGVVLSKLKTFAVRSAMHLTGAWLRNPWTQFGKIAVWNRICVPHLSWRSDEIVCRASRGQRFRVRPNDFVENRLCFFGEWEPAITAVFESSVRAGDVVVDVGANVGYYTVLSSALVGRAGRVYALEPSPSIRDRLDANLRLNNVTNVVVLPVAAWHETGGATLHLVDGNRGSSSLGDAKNSTSCEKVEMKRLDDLIPQEEWTRIRLLKIDVEGAEWSALRGGEQILRSSSNLTVICEVTPELIGGLAGSPQDLLNFMRDLGFAAYRIENDYSANGYVSRSTSSPIKLQSQVDEPCDLVFTR